MDDALIGMVGRRRVRKAGASPRSQAAADFEDLYIQVTGRVGPSHYLVEVIGRGHSVIRDIAALARYAWFETGEQARGEAAIDADGEDGAA